MIVPPQNVNTLIVRLLKDLALQPQLFAQIAGLGIRGVGPGQQLAFYVTVASREVQGQIDAFMTQEEDLLKELEVRFDQRLSVQQVQIGIVRPVGLGNPVSVVSLGARVALENDPTDGTLGAILSDACRNRYFLTCRHVLDGKEGDRVVLRNVIGDDQWVARIAAVSKWELGDTAARNQTDFALARILDTVVADPQTPIGTSPLSASPAAGTPNMLFPLLSVGRTFRVTETSWSVMVNFPYGQIRLSYMWLADSPDGAGPLANFGDSGSLFVAKDRCGSLGAAALAVAVSDEYSEWDEDKNGVRYGSPRLLLCPMTNVFTELAGRFPGLGFIG